MSCKVRADTPHNLAYSAIVKCRLLRIFLITQGIGMSDSAASSSIKAPCLQLFCGGRWDKTFVHYPGFLSWTGSSVHFFHMHRKVSSIQPVKQLFILLNCANTTSSSMMKRPDHHQPPTPRVIFNIPSGTSRRNMPLNISAASCAVSSNCCAITACVLGSSFAAR